MPIYEYRCTHCGKVTEVIQKFSDLPLTTCEACSGPLEKLISRAAFQLKGGGWFDQGYGKGSSSSTTSTPSSSSTSSGGGSSDGGSDSKPEKKASGGSCGAGCGCH